MLALHPGQRGHVSFHQRAHDLQPGPHRESQQALGEVRGDLFHADRDLLPDHERVRAHGTALVPLHLVVPCLGGVFGRTPNTYRKAGVRRGTATEVLRDPGQPPPTVPVMIDGALP
jgi:hypothetical protein